MPQTKTKKKSKTSKKLAPKQKSKSKKQSTNDGKNPSRTVQKKYFDFSELTEANISSLRWDNVIADPLLDQDRIEQYKELRRQRYAVARKQAIEHLIQRIRLTEPTVATQ